MLEPFLEIGKIVGTHGVRGEMRVYPVADAPDFLLRFRTLYFDPAGQAALRVRSARVHGNLVLIRAVDVDSPEAAARFVGQAVYIRRADADLPEGRYFIADLIGCDVFRSETGERLGVLCEVSQNGAGDIWHIRTGGAEVLVPAVSDFVREVSPEARRVVLSPIKGMFDDAD